jgi:hypothetical protein
MEVLKKVHELTMRKIELMRKQVEQDPQLSNYMERNMRDYGVPFLSLSYGGRWRENLPKDVRDLLFEDLPHQLVEIRVYPEDPDGHHWGVEYNLLLWDEVKGFVKAVDYERGKRGDDGGGNEGPGV